MCGSVWMGVCVGMGYVGRRVVTGAEGTNLLNQWPLFAAFFQPPPHPLYLRLMIRLYIVNRWMFKLRPATLLTHTHPHRARSLLIACRTIIILVIVLWVLMQLLSLFELN